MKWIKVEDRLPPLPEYVERYLVYATFLDSRTYIEPKFEVYEAKFDKNGEWSYGEFDYLLIVKYWMPLPEAPNE